MIGAAQRYTELMTELLFERAQAGGSLPEEREAAYVEELDRFWWAMTKAEQDEVERLFEESSLDAPSELGVEDTVLAPGAKTPPRKRVDEAA